MPFDAAAYGADIAAILAMDGDGDRLIPLVRGAATRAEAQARIEAKARIEALAARRLAPQTAVAGLYLYHSLWDDAHETAQDIPTPEGSYWHAIVHRQEPDAGNAGYWFRQVGDHEIFPALRERAMAIGVEFGARWNPRAFIEYCEQAREDGGDVERKALEVQRAEWQLLFDFCAKSGGA